LIGFSTDRIISDNLEHQVSPSFEIETQLDVLSNFLFARNKSGIGNNPPHTNESYAQNDKKAPKNTFIHVLTLLSTVILVPRRARMPRNYSFSDPCSAVTAFRESSILTFSAIRS